MVIIILIISCLTSLRCINIKKCFIKILHYFCRDSLNEYFMHGIKFTNKVVCPNSRDEIKNYRCKNTMG